jgi:hypothetical protein
MGRFFQVVLVLVNVCILMAVFLIPIRNWKRYNKTTNNTIIVENSFLHRFHDINNNNSINRYIVYHGRHWQGLGSNILPLMSTLVFSVLTERKFVYVWNRGGNIADPGDVFDFPLSLQRNTYWLQTLRDTLPSHCELHPWSLWPPYNTSKASECWKELACAETLLKSHTLRDCDYIVMSSNVYFLHVLQQHQREIQPLLQSYFPQLKHGGSVLHHISADFLSMRPSLQIQFDYLTAGWNWDEIVALHIRSALVGDGLSGMKCAQLLVEQSQGRLKRIFVAADKAVIRDAAHTYFGNSGLLTMFDLPTNYNAEEQGFRGAHAGRAVQELYVLARARTRILSLPWSTFAHLAYALANHTTSVTYDLSCTVYDSLSGEMPAWQWMPQHVRCPNDVIQLKRCPGTDNVP